MLRSFASLMILAGFGSMVAAGPFGVFGRRGGNYYPAQQQATGYSDGELASAQGVANRMARLNVMRHFGGWNYSFEGVGCGSTPEAAIANTCRPRHGGAPRETGVAQGSDGRFYACNRW
jgi:hypothetical protein